MANEEHKQRGRKIKLAVMALVQEQLEDSEDDIFDTEEDLAAVLYLQVDGNLWVHVHVQHVNLDSLGVDP